MRNEDVARSQIVLLVELSADSHRSGGLVARVRPHDDTALRMMRPTIIELRFWREGHVVRGSVRGGDGVRTGYFQGNNELLDFLASTGICLADDS